MSRPLRSILLTIAPTFCLFSCSTSNRFAETTGYSGTTGVLTAVETAPLDQVWSATSSVLEGLRLKPHERERDASSGVIAGKTGDGRTIRVTLKRITDRETEVRVHILYNRDRAPCEEILVAIQKRVASG